MAQILALRFRDNGQLYYFDSGPFEFRPGERLLVKTDQGPGIGTVAQIHTEPPIGMEAGEIKPIQRPATPEDLAQHDENRELARQALRYCRQCIHDRKLDMKLVDVEIIQDRSKMIFYFTAPGRIDFRELVKDLVKAYRTRIELRQIGVRHETQMVGALGNCGQMCCCARFIRKFQPVTIKMAKEQNLFLNPNKISGMCGRLLCCLAYEQSTYEDFQKRCPKFGKRYQTSQGPMKVLRSNIFRETISVITEDGEDREISLEEWRAIAGESWVPHVPAQQPPKLVPIVPARPPQEAPPVQESLPADDGEVVAEAGPDDTPRAKSKRKRKRKSKGRRPEGGADSSSEPSGE